ncbi:MAG: hypothetical protein ACI4DZ_07165 [Oliverpabstia sp.]
MFDTLSSGTNVDLLSGLEEAAIFSSASFFTMAQRLEQSILI